MLLKKQNIYYILILYKIHIFSHKGCDIKLYVAERFRMRDFAVFLDHLIITYIFIFCDDLENKIFF